VTATPPQDLPSPEGNVADRGREIAYSDSYRLVEVTMPYGYNGFNFGCRQVPKTGDSDLIGAFPENGEWLEDQTISLAQVHKDDLEDLVPRRPDHNGRL